MTSSSSTKTALAELALSGCTTASDHLYLFPNGSRLDDEIAAAGEMGVRIHASRGSMSLGESKGGLPPDSVVDSEESILKDSQRLIEKYHDAEPGSMVQIVLAPCSPFSVTGELMKQSAVLAREYGVHLHTHLAETQDEEVFLHGNSSATGRWATCSRWIGWGRMSGSPHSVWINKEEQAVYARTGCGVAHCPCSNMRLASGIAPIWEYLKAGVNVGIGVDGSASNDSSHLLAEARQALLLARVRAGVEGASLSGSEAPILTARQALEMATVGGAAVLGRSDIGSLEPGKCADFIAINLNRLDYAGALHDPLAAILFCNPVSMDYNVVGGKFIVKEGHLQTLDLPNHIRKHNQAAARLLEEKTL